MKGRQFGVLAHMGTVSAARFSNRQIIGGRWTGNECFAEQSGGAVDLSAPCLLRSRPFWKNLFALVDVSFIPAVATRRQKAHNVVPTNTNGTWIMYSGFTSRNDPSLRTPVLSEWTASDVFLVKQSRIIALHTAARVRAASVYSTDRII